MKQLIHSLWEILQYIISPPLCYGCRNFLSQRSILCYHCNAQLITIAPKLLKISSSYTLTIHAIARYGEPLKRIISAKYYSDHLMFYALADLMWQKTIIPHLEIDYFIPVPLHWTRKMNRGFNQAEILAKRLSQHKSIPVCNNLVIRTKRTQFQASIDKLQRKANVSHAFIVKNGFTITDKHIMLVDDLCTTGATAVEIAKVLAPYRPASIQLIVACRAL
ncbi:ComF family protein [Candidatus Dependentiae bacterium]|nr:ComF family protein [Candidatus Dependentiae bacterium]